MLFNRNFFFIFETVIYDLVINHLNYLVSFRIVIYCCAALELLSTFHYLKVHWIQYSASDCIPSCRHTIH